MLNAYNALANGGSLFKPQIVRRVLAPDGTVVQEFQPELMHTLDVDPDTLRIMRLAAREVVTSRHTFNLVDLPLVVAGKTGTAEFGVRDSKGRLPYHTWFAAFVPKFTDDAGRTIRRGPTLSFRSSRFAYGSNTKGNAAVEIVKYFLQQHYDLGRRPDAARPAREEATSMAGISKRRLDSGGSPGANRFARSPRRRRPGGGNR